MVKNVKELFQIIFLVLFTALMASCTFGDYINEDKYITADTLNYISMVISNSSMKVETETYFISSGMEFPGPKGTGSAMIFKNEGNKYYILTNNHVIELSNTFNHRYTVEDIYGEKKPATVLFKDDEYDLAVLEFSSNSVLETLEFASVNPRIGEMVFSIGSPLGKHNVITAGRILSYGVISQVDYKIIIHDALIRLGSSGSMLINGKYQVVGINTWGLEDDVSSEYVKGGATPVEKIFEFLEKYEFIIT